MEFTLIFWDKRYCNFQVRTITEIRPLFTEFLMSDIHNDKEESWTDAVIPEEPEEIKMRLDEGAWRHCQL